MLRDEDTEALYWLDLAKQVLAGEVTPDAALRALRAVDLSDEVPL